MLRKYLTDEMCNRIDLYKNSVTDITIAKNFNMYMSVAGCTVDTDCFVSEVLFERILSNMCNGSIYANQSTLKQGYISLENGVRVGVVGTAVLSSDNTISHLRDITAMNIRITRFLPGVADRVIPIIKHNGRLFNSLIIAPPGAGKTTLLRDIAIQLGKQYRIAIADERCEVIPQNMQCGHMFIMRNAPKDEAMRMLLRSMSPQIIITDEIGTEGDEKAISKLIYSGVKIICTAHGYSEKDILKRSVFKHLIQEQMIEKIIVLSAENGPGTLEKIIDTKEYLNG
ncbi:MAG: stage III sporulation protein AA [Clostridia bacterium]|nr:stage III sporulation protein AA [Clostridia bacterium]